MWVCNCRHFRSVLDMQYHSRRPLCLRLVSTAQRPASLYESNLFKSLSFIFLLPVILLLFAVLCRFELCWQMNAVPYNAICLLCVYSGLIMASHTQPRRSKTRLKYRRSSVNMPCGSCQKNQNILHAGRGEYKKPQAFAIRFRTKILLESSIQDQQGQS